MMTVSHKFVSPKVEQADPTIVGPNEWNASHVVTGFGTQNITGTLDGVNNIFTVAAVLTDFIVFRNGIAQSAGDYSWVTDGISTTTITFIYPPASDDTLKIWGF
jgi:hypothetical protein